MLGRKRRRWLRFPGSSGSRPRCSDDGAPADVDSSDAPALGIGNFLDGSRASPIPVAVIATGTPETLAAGDTPTAPYLREVLEE